MDRCPNLSAGIGWKALSDNFHVAKVMSILAVVFGHYFNGLLPVSRSVNALFTVPTTIGLFIFAFSSGYFTAHKYSPPVQLRSFLGSKVRRLFVPVVVIDLFLLVMFLVQGRPGIFAWDSIPPLLGMNGFQEWFGAGESSPYGNGLWFFTLLILFYFTYPLIARINRSRLWGIVVLVLGLGAAILLHRIAFQGHFLWLCAWAFVLGAWSGRRILLLNPWFAGAVVAASTVLMFGLNWFLGLNGGNFIFLLLIGTGICLFLVNAPLLGWLRPLTAPFSCCLLEIYFVHTYLFQYPPDLPVSVGFAISLILILGVSWLLSHVSIRLLRMLPIVGE